MARNHSFENKNKQKKNDGDGVIIIWPCGLMHQIAKGFNLTCTKLQEFLYV